MTNGQGGGEASGHSRRAGRSNGGLLALALALIVCYLIVEFVGGLISNSLALLADAGHMLADAAALGMSLFALWVARQPPTPRRTYGYYRAEILAALANGATLLAISVFIFVEAYHRISAHPEVQGPLMLAIALGGLAVNAVCLGVLDAGKAESLNLRGAWLHVLTDALGSVAAIFAGAVVWAFGWWWADPALSVVIGLLVISSSWGLLKEATAVLMEGAPGHLDVDSVRDALIGLPGIRGVHDLHVWSITSGREALSAHLTTDSTRPPEELLRSARATLHTRFGISHVTIQVEPMGFLDCRTSC